MTGGKRKGAGRPRKYGASEKIDIRMPDDLIAALVALAREQSVAESRVITRSDVAVAELRKSPAVRAKLKLKR